LARAYGARVDRVVGTAASLADLIGYEGARRRILVVDNEEADRQLLLRWLEPLGFAVSQAVDGEDALRQLRAGLRPDVVFMDLAMPGMDGWETLRRIRAMDLVPAPALAVVSANAFDKGLDNDVNLPSDDFLVKPVRRTELLAWLQQRLLLEWQYTTPSSPPTPAPTQLARNAAHGLSTEAIDSLRELAQLGYYRGFVKRLDALQASHPEIAPWAQPLKALAREFRFEAILEQLQPTP